MKYVMNSYLLTYFFLFFVRLPNVIKPDLLLMNFSEQLWNSADTLLYYRGRSFCQQLFAGIKSRMGHLAISLTVFLLEQKI